MCLGVPGLVTEVDELTALVDFWGVRRRVRLDLVDEPVGVGDYVLNHVGFAIRRIPPEEVQTTLALYEQLLQEAARNGQEDLMVADVRAEIEAGTAGSARGHASTHVREREASASGSLEPLRGANALSNSAGGGAPRA